jgi:zinc/manganese transport system ATP-binding protein
MPALASSLDSSDAAVRIEGASVRFDDRLAVSKASLELRSGTVTAIVGPNGAGKSTLAEVIVGARRVTAGTVTRSISRVAFVPQRADVPAALPLSVRDVVDIGVRMRGRRARRRAGDVALARVDAARLASRPFSSLSGGQRQRVLLAQGLAGDAEILVLDEPTTGLDADSSARIRQVLVDEAARGVAVVCVSHDPSLIAAAHCVIRLTEGRIVDDR